MTTKKRSFIRLLRLSLFASGRHRKPPAEPGVFLGNLLVAIRPLCHLPHSPTNQAYQPILAPPTSPKPEAHADAPPSPVPSSWFSDVTDDGMSRCNTSRDLMELEPSDGKEEEGDEAIDAKAEKFIARFYEEMRLQQLESIESGSQYSR